MEKAYAKLNTKSWHYKLMKLVLGSITPTPKNMHNLCPYFWLLIFSMLTFVIIVPIKYLFKLGVWFFGKLDNLIDNFYLEPEAEKWEKSLSDLEMWKIFNEKKDFSIAYRKVNGIPSMGNDWGIRRNIVYTLWEKKYQTSATIISNSSSKVSGGWSDGFIVWNQDQEKAFYKEQSEIRKLADSRRSYSESLAKFREDVSDWASEISYTVASRKDIVKWTKRVVGVIITGVLIVATYFLVGLIGKEILWIADNITWDITIGIGIFLLAIGIFLGIIWILDKFLAYLKEKGTSIWWVKILYFICFWIIWMPIKVIFYHFIWELILVNLYFLVWSGLKSLWKGFIGFLGIFGEYFGSSYSDYCMELRWDENETETEE